MFINNNGTTKKRKGYCKRCGRYGLIYKFGWCRECYFANKLYKKSGYSKVTSQWTKNVKNAKKINQYINMECVESALIKVYIRLMYRLFMLDKYGEQYDKRISCWVPY